MIEPVKLVMADLAAHTPLMVAEGVCYVVCIEERAESPGPVVIDSGAELEAYSTDRDPIGCRELSRIATDGADVGQRDRLSRNLIEAGSVETEPEIVDQVRGKKPRPSQLHEPVFSRKSLLKRQRR